MTAYESVMASESEVVLPEPGSTDWLDGIRTAEDVRDKNKLVIWCSSCSNWFHFERDPNNKAMLAAHGQVCDCGSTNGFIGSSIISKRTWSPDKKPPKMVKTRRR